MTDTTIHRVKSVRVTEVREHDTFISRTIVVEDEKGERHELTLFSNDVDNEEALRIWL